MSGSSSQPQTHGDRLEIRSSARADGAQLRLSGELTHATVDGFRDRLRDTQAAAPDVLVIDLRELRFLDSAALGALVEADTRSRRDGRRLMLITTPGPVERLLEITRLDGRLEVVAEPPEPAERES